MNDVEACVPSPKAEDDFAWIAFLESHSVHGEVSLGKEGIWVGVGVGIPCNVPGDTAMVRHCSLIMDICTDQRFAMTIACLGMRNSRY